MATLVAVLLGLATTPVAAFFTHSCMNIELGLMSAFHTMAEISHIGFVVRGLGFAIRSQDVGTCPDGGTLLRPVVCPTPGEVWQIRNCTYFDDISRPGIELYLPVVSGGQRTFRYHCYDDGGCGTNGTNGACEETPMIMIKYAREGTFSILACVTLGVLFGWEIFRDATLAIQVDRKSEWLPIYVHITHAVSLALLVFLPLAIHAVVLEQATFIVLLVGVVLWYGGTKLFIALSAYNCPGCVPPGEDPEGQKQQIRKLLSPVLGIGIAFSMSSDVAHDINRHRTMRRLRFLYVSMAMIFAFVWLLDVSYRLKFTPTACWGAFTNMLFAAWIFCDMYDEKAEDARRNKALRTVHQDLKADPVVPVGQTNMPQIDDEDTEPIPEGGIDLEWAEKENAPPDEPPGRHLLKSCS